MAMRGNKRWSNLAARLAAAVVSAILFHAIASAQVATSPVASRVQLLLGSPPNSISALASQKREHAPQTSNGQSATLLPSGLWLLLGGEGDDGRPQPGAALVDPSGEETPLVPAMISARSGHTASVLPNGNVLIVGGVGVDGQLVATAEIFNLDSGQFRIATEVALTPRAFHSATLLTDGRLLIVGGVNSAAAVLDDVEVFNPISNLVERFDARLETARFGHLASLLPSAPALVSGGMDRDNQPVTSAELFDPALRRFLPVDKSTETLLPQPGDENATPAVTAMIPAHGADNVAVDQLISVRFSKPLQVQSLNTGTITLFGPTGIVATKVTPAEAGLLAFITPKQDLWPASDYTLLLKGLVDTQGLALPLVAQSFRTMRLGPETSNPPLDASDAARAGQAVTDVAPHASNVTSAIQATDSAGTPLPSPPAAPVWTAAPSKADDDELWIPGPAQFTGRWRIDRPEPARTRPVTLAHVGVTGLSGEVRRLNDLPLVNTIVRVGNVEARTDADGQFLLADLPPGGQVLEIDARTSNRGDTHYGVYFVRVEIQGKQTTVLPYTIWMPKLDPRGYVKIPSPTVEETVVTTETIPGLELRIPAGTIIRDRDGKIVTEINITAIPTDRPPFPLPDFNVPVYFTIQPGGAWLQGMTVEAAKGARLIYPNYAHEVPSALAAFWNYDARGKGWYVYGMGKVSADGGQVVPDPGVAIYEFSGAMINNDPPPPPGPDPCNDLCCAPPDPPPPGGGDGDGDWSKDDDGGNSGCDGGGDPVSLSTGQFTHTERDLWLPDVMPLDIKRTYRALDLNLRSFGIGMSHPYNMFLWSAQQYQQVDLILPSGSRVHYVRTSPGNGYSDAVFASQAPGQWAGSTIAWNEVYGGWNLVLRDGRLWRFGDTRPLQDMTDRNGNKITITRRDSNGTSGPITGLDSPNGRWIRFTLDAAGLVTAATDNGGRTFSYAYDASNQLTSVTDPNGGVRLYTWNAAHRLTSIKDPNGNTIVQNVYDANTRVTQQTEADGSKFSYAYTLNNGKVTQTDLTDRRGNVRRVAFDANGFIVSNTFPLGKPEQQITTFNVDPTKGWLLSKTDALGRTTGSTYDALGNRTSATMLSGTPNAVTTSFTYTPNYNAVATITDPLGHVTNFSYDLKGNRTQVTDPNGNSRSFSYDAQGKVLTIVDGLNHTTTLSYSGPDLATVTDALGRTTTPFSDAVGRTSSVRDALGNFWTANYDNLNRKTNEIDPLGNTVGYAYDANGKLLTFTDPRGGVTRYTYNNMSKPASRQDPLSNSESYVYDLAGKLIRFTDRKGQVQGFAYDNRARRTLVGFGATIANPTAYQSTIGYTYDAGNRVTQIVDSVYGTITRTYDGLDRLTQEQTPQGTVTYTYDAAGRRSSMTVAGQSATTYTYDIGNRLKQISRGAETIAFTYDAANRRTKTTLSNGVTISYAYDNANQLSSIAYANGATTIGNLTYAYDASGRRVGVGGSLAQVNLPAAIASAVYNAGNQLTQWNGQSYGYDLNGNLSTDGAKTLTWNSRDQLSSLSGSVAASFQYDAFGRRSAKTVSGTNTGFVYDGLNFVQELTGGAPKANLLTGLGIDEVFSRTQGAATSSFLTDALGTSIALTDAGGATTTSYSYEPYGATTQTGAANENSQQFTGRENDGTGLMYFRARYYNPNCGRFAAEDPIGIAGGMNRYQYVSGNPISRHDLLGLNADPPGMTTDPVRGGCSATEFFWDWGSHYAETIDSIAAKAIEAAMHVRAAAGFADIYGGATWFDVLGNYWFWGDLSLLGLAAETGLVGGYAIGGAFMLGVAVGSGIYAGLSCASR